MSAAEPSAPASRTLADAHTALREVSGKHLLRALRSALAYLQANQTVVDDLNVFPVPDGDTGSNMYLTLRSAVEDADHVADQQSAAAVMAAAAHGSLMGARGNSGVILSQILRGFAQGLRGRARVDAAAVAAALQEAQSVAYKAVMKPTEGTILTVIREAAGAAQRAAAAGADDIREVLGATVREAHAAVERTPQQLAVLRDAGVVDAGGFGLAVILEGCARALDDPDGAEPVIPVAVPIGALEPAVRPPGETALNGPAPQAGRRGAAAVAPRAEGWGYCTEFLVSGPGLDVDALRTTLAALGSSSMVVGDADLVRVHIHTGDPAALIAAAAVRGRLSKLKVEDMSAQHHEVLERAAAEEGGAATGPRRKPLGVVGVAPGEGFREILVGLGVDCVVEGGQTMNPSTQDLLDGVRAAGADGVILLPNNANVLLTAQQVQALAGDVAVRVVPTRNLPQGIAALLALEPGGDLEATSARMEEAAGAVTTVEVTRAVRDSVADGREIHEGDAIALVDERITAVGPDIPSVVEAAVAAAPRPPALITVYRGSGVPDADTEQLMATLRRCRPGAELELHEGGQEHYPFILSLE